MADCLRDNNGHPVRLGLIYACERGYEGIVMRVTKNGRGEYAAKGFRLDDRTKP